VIRHLNCFNKMTVLIDMEMSSYKSEEYVLEMVKSVGITRIYSSS